MALFVEKKIIFITLLIGLFDIVCSFYTCFLNGYGGLGLELHRAIRTFAFKEKEEKKKNLEEKRKEKGDIGKGARCLFDV